MMSEGMRSEDVVADLRLELGECTVAVAGDFADAAVEGLMS
jgi:hypothetical protein